MKLLKLTALIIIFSVLTTACTQEFTLPDFIGEAGNFDISDISIDFGWVKGNSSHAYYEENTPQYDAFIKKLSDTENKFKCEINFIKNEDISMENVKVKLSAGSHAFDLLISGEVFEFAKAGLLHSIDSFSDIINIHDEKYGGKISMEGSMLNGVPYGITPVMWPGFSLSQTGLMAYNRDMFKSNGITDFHEYYENGTWTWDTYKNEYIAKNNIQNAEGSQIYLLQTDSTELYTAVIAANDVNFIKTNDDRTLSAEPFPSSFKNAISWWQDLIADYGDRILKSSNCHELLYYRRQEALTCSVSRAHLITGNIAYNDLATFETGVMPWPAGPDAEYGKWRQWCGYFYGFAIPTTAKEPEAAALVLENISEPFEEFGGREGLYDYYYGNIFSTETDSAIFVETMLYPKYEYEVLEKVKDVRDKFGDVIITPEKSLSEAMGQLEDSFTEEIEKYMIPNYKAVYGE